MLKFKDFVINLEEGVSGSVFKTKKNKRIQIKDPENVPGLAEEFFDLIQAAYMAIGGHAKIQTPKDVFADKNRNYWEGVDLHGDEDFDLILFGQNTKYGVKYSGVGHDDSKEAKKAYLSKFTEDLFKPGNYLEVSENLADILLNKNVPVVDKEDDVVKVLGKQVQRIGELVGKEGNGWYTRNIGGHAHDKILVGRPKI